MQWFKTDFSRHVVLAHKECDLGDAINPWAFSLLPLTQALTLTLTLTQAPPVALTPTPSPTRSPDPNPNPDPNPSSWAFSLLRYWLKAVFVPVNRKFSVLQVRS